MFFVVLRLMHSPPQPRRYNITMVDALPGCAKQSSGRGGGIITGLSCFNESTPLMQEKLKYSKQLWESVRKMVGDDALEWRYSNWYDGQVIWHFTKCGRPFCHPSHTQQAWVQRNHQSHTIISINIGWKGPSISSSSRTSDHRCSDASDDSDHAKVDGNRSDGNTNGPTHASIVDDKLVINMESESFVKHISQITPKEATPAILNWCKARFNDNNVKHVNLGKCQEYYEYFVNEVKCSSIDASLVESINIQAFNTTTKKSHPPSHVIALCLRQACGRRNYSIAILIYASRPNLNIWFKLVILWNAECTFFDRK